MGVVSLREGPSYIFGSRLCAHLRRVWTRCATDVLSYRLARHGTHGLALGERLLFERLTLSRRDLGRHENQPVAPVVLRRGRSI